MRTRVFTLWGRAQAVREKGGRETPCMWCCVCCLVCCLVWCCVGRREGGDEEGEGRSVCGVVLCAVILTLHLSLSPSLYHQGI